MRFKRGKTTDASVRSVVLGVVDKPLDTGKLASSE